MYPPRKVALGADQTIPSTRTHALGKDVRPGTRPRRRDRVPAPVYIRVVVAESRLCVNTTHATTGATTLLLPVQNTHTLHDPKRDTEHARAGGVEDGLSVGGLDGGGDVGDVVCEEAAGGRAALCAPACPACVPCVSRLPPVFLKLTYFAYLYLLFTFKHVHFA